MKQSVPATDQSVSPKRKKKKRGPFKVYRHGGWALYFWHGMRLSTWWRLLRRGRFAVTLNCMPNIVAVTLAAPVNSLLYRVSELVYARRVAAVTLDEAPIFVLGHWRTGTTFLHDLLACDPRFGFPTTYECFFPHHFLLSERVARSWFNVFLPKKRPMDDVPVGVERPQEDEFALCNLGLPSPYMCMAFPRQGPVHMDYFDLRGLTDAEKQQWTDGFLWFIRRVMAHQGKPLILKSPVHTARVRTLLEIFPNARFVHISRDPLDVFPSTLRLWKSLNSVQGLQNPAHDDAWLDEFVLSNFERMFRCYEEDVGRIPDGQIAEIRYEDLVADPKGVLAALYAELGLGDMMQAQTPLDAYLSRTKDHKRNVHELDDETVSKVRARWGAYAARFGYGDRVEGAGLDARG